MAIIRFYIDIELDEDDVREDLGLSENTVVTKADIVDRAETLLNYRIQDRCICAENFEHRVID